MRKSIVMTAAIGASIVLLMLSSMTAAQQIIFEMDDPRGDDYGPGTYVYPTADVFVPGVFDLLHFKVSKTATHAIFEFKYKALGPADNPNPWGSKYGFCLQFQQVYIDKDGKRGSGRTDTVGANVEIDPANAWEVALTIGPSWDSEAQANWVLVGTTTHEWKMEISANPATNSITAKVPIALIGEPTEEWVYTVITGSWDMGHMRSIGAEAEEYVGGGADPDAIIAGVVPLTYDILVPEGMDQTTVLKGYDTKAGTFAVVPAVPPRPGFPIAVIAMIVVIAIAVIGVVVVAVRRRKRK